MHHGAVVPILTDDLVRLDAHAESDVQAHVAGEDDETAKRFGWWPRRSTEATVRTAFGEWAQDWMEARPRRAFAVRDAHGRRLVGGCELRLQVDGSVAHVSYWTNAEERRRGYALHALRLLVGYGQSLGVHVFEAHVEPSNIGSRRTAERAGFLASGTVIDDQGRTLLRYTRTSPSPRD